MIHETAIIDPTAKIASDVAIGPYSVIGANVEIGSGTWIGPHVCIKGDTRIGSENKIYQFSSLGEDSQALGENDSSTRLEIGDRNIIREYVTMNRGSVRGGGLTKVGNDNLFMAYTHVAHDCMLGDHIIFSNAASIAGHVHVGNYVTLGGFTCVHQFVRIGEYGFSGLGTVINRDVPPYVMVAGNHASAYGINKEGLKRRGFEMDTIRALHKAFMALIKSHKKRSEALKALEKTSKEFPEVANFVNFIKESERGIVRS